MCIEYSYNSRLTNCRYGSRPTRYDFLTRVRDWTSSRGIHRNYYPMRHLIMVLVEVFYEVADREFRIGFFFIS